MLQHEGPRRGPPRFRTRAYCFGDARQRLGHQPVAALGARGGPVLDRVVHGQQAAPVDRGEQALQPQHVFDPRARRARVSRHQAPVPLHEGGYKGIAKNAARGVSPFGLTDLYLARRALTS